MEEKTKQQSPALQSDCNFMFKISPMKDGLFAEGRTLELLLVCLAATKILSQNIHGRKSPLRCKMEAFDGTMEIREHSFKSYKRGMMSSLGEILQPASGGRRKTFPGSFPGMERREQKSWLMIAAESTLS